MAIRHLAAAAVSLALAGAACAAESRGPVTNLPLPRYVSMKAATGNVRRGPSLTHKIDWVFKRRGMPLEITAEYGHWRRVQDRDGAGGWVHYALLSGVRTVLVEEDMLTVHARPDTRAPVTAAFAKPSGARSRPAATAAGRPRKSFGASPRTSCANNASRHFHFPPNTPG